MSPQLRRWLFPSLLVLAVLALYGQVLDHQFTAWDDHGYVDHNPDVCHGLTWASVHWAFTSTSHSNYHPLTWLSHMLDIELFGLWAGGHAFTNLVLHALNALLLWRLIQTLTGRSTVALFVAVLFAIHPLNVEAVANISQRKSVLSACFGLLSLLAYVGYARRGNAWRYLLVLFLATLSLLAKSLFVTLPCLFLLLDYWPLRRTPGRGYSSPASEAQSGREAGWWWLVAEKLPFFTLSLAIGLLTMYFQKSTGAMDTADVDRLTSFTGAVASYVLYLQNTVWPSGLAAFYPLPESYPAAVLPLALVTLLTITGVCLWSHRQRPYLLMGWLWFSITLVPMAGFVRVGGMAAADRYCYLPLIGIFWALALLGEDRLARVQPCLQRGAQGLGLAALVLLGIVAHRQVGFWKDTEASFNRILATQGPHELFPALIGYDLFDRGEFARSIPYFRRSLAVMPNNHRVAANLGIALLCTGATGEAERWLRQALANDPTRSPGALNALGLIAERRGNPAEAVDCYREALSRAPGFSGARLALIRLLNQTGRTDEARALAEAGVTIHSHDVALRQQLLELSKPSPLPELCPPP